jgi:hypothetical protein
VLKFTNIFQLFHDFSINFTYNVLYKLTLTSEGKYVIFYIMKISSKRIISIYTKGLKALICGFLVFSFLVNAVIPKITLDQESSSVLYQILQTQSALICFLSFSSIPIKIIDGMFNDERSALKTSAAQKNNKHEDKKNTSCDFSIVSFDKKLENRQAEKNESFRFFNAVSRNVVSTSIACETIARNNLDFMLFVFIYIIMLCVVLPRSGSSENAIIMLINNLKTHLPEADGFFVYRGILCI